MKKLILALASIALMATAVNADGTITGSAGQTGAPFSYTWMSPDNSLKHNHWHHVSFRWSDDTPNRIGKLQVDDHVVDVQIK